MQKIKISETLFSCAKAYFTAKAAANTFAEKKEKIVRKLLTDMKFYSSKKQQERRNAPERITEPEDAWMMDTEEHQEFCVCVREEWEKMGFEIKGCGEQWDFIDPALEAENVAREAAKLMVKVGIEETVPVDMREALIRGVKIQKHFEEMLDLICRLVVSRKKIKVGF